MQLRVHGLYQKIKKRDQQIEYHEARHKIHSKTLYRYQCIKNSTERRTAISRKQKSACNNKVIQVSQVALCRLFHSA